MRLESVPNAIEQARVAAAAIIGKPIPYSAVPWFWSDQYDLKLQMVGLSQGFDQLIIRGDINGESFSAFYLQDGVVISADAVNRPQEFMIAKKLVAERIRAPATQLADAAFEIGRATSELQSLMRISYAVFRLKKKKITHLLTPLI